ncbi:hypothetical protein ACHAXM_002616 [Skeletonema potamos]
MKDFLCWKLHGNEGRVWRSRFHLQTNMAKLMTEMIEFLSILMLTSLLKLVTLSGQTSWPSTLTLVIGFTPLQSLFQSQSLLSN